MIGIIIVTHHELGKNCISTAQSLLGKTVESVVSISIDLKVSTKELHDLIADHIHMLNHLEGILLLTDMFGTTASNLCFSFLQKGRTEVVTGINLPILLKAIQLQHNQSISDVAAELENYGKNSIMLANRLIEGNKVSKS